MVVTKFILEGNNVLLKNALDEVLAVLPSVGTHAFKRDEDETHIYLSNTTSNRDPIHFKIPVKASEVTIPSGAWTQTTLLQELSDNFLNITQSVNVSGGGEVSLPSTYFNAGGWLRTQGKTILGEYSHSFDKQSDLKDERKSAGATSAWENLTDGVNGVKMTVAANEYCIRETIFAHYYSKGNGQFYEATTSNFQLKTNFIKRLGYFSSSTTAPYSADFDGMFIESDGVTNEYYLCLYRSGTLVLRQPRTGWTDKLDGTGASGLTIDWTKFEITGGDFLWLGGKSARFYFAVGGNLILVYEYAHAGAVNGLIMACPNQPLRYEIRGAASAIGTDYLYDICSVVATEGDKNQIGLIRGIDLDALTLRANIIGTYYALFGVRLKSGRRNAIININSFGAFSTSNDAFRVTLIKNPTITGAVTWQDWSASSSIEFFLGDTVSNPASITITGGQKMPSIGVSAKSGDRDLALNDAIFQLSRLIDGTNDIYVIGVTPLTANLFISGQTDLLERPS